MIQWYETQYGDPNRPTVLFLHGFLGSGTDWRLVVEGLRDTCRSVCVDLPGHGRTPLPPQSEPLTMEDCAAALIARLDALRIPRCGLVGYSMGGRLALYLALTCPDRFDRVLLESASPGLRTEAERQQRRDHDEQVAQRLDRAAHDPEMFRSFLGWWYDQPVFASLAKDPARRDALIESRRNNDPRSLAAALRGLSAGAQPGLWDRLDAYTRPVLLIVGELDRKYRQIAEAMSEGRRHIAVQSLADCGHNVHYENPTGYTTLLRAFLSAP